MMPQNNIDGLFMAKKIKSNCKHDFLITDNQIEVWERCKHTNDAECNCQFTRNDPSAQNGAGTRHYSAVYECIYCGKTDSSFIPRQRM